MAAFKKYDQDGNGGIDKTAFHKLLSEMGFFQGLPVEKQVCTKNSFFWLGLFLFGAYQPSAAISGVLKGRGLDEISGPLDENGFGRRRRPKRAYFGLLFAYFCPFVGCAPVIHQSAFGGLDEKAQGLDENPSAT